MVENEMDIKQNSTTKTENIYNWKTVEIWQMSH